MSKQHIVANFEFGPRGRRRLYRLTQACSLILAIRGRRAGTAPQICAAPEGEARSIRNVGFTFGHSRHCGARHPAGIFERGSPAATCAGGRGAIDCRFGRSPIRGTYRRSAANSGCLPRRRRGCLAINWTGRRLRLSHDGQLRRGRGARSWPACG